VDRGRVTRPPSESYRAGKRGRHKRRHSPETIAWNREHAIPKRPPWMDGATYRALARLRRELERA
jgi:hypothetical protein